MLNNSEEDDIAMANKITIIRKATEKNSTRQSPAVIKYQKQLEKFYIGLAISACMAKSIRLVLNKLN